MVPVNAIEPWGRAEWSDPTTALHASRTPVAPVMKTRMSVLCVKGKCDRPPDRRISAAGRGSCAKEGTVAASRRSVTGP